jgi:hypothetical protein
VFARNPAHCPATDAGFARHHVLRRLRCARLISIFFSRRSTESRLYPFAFRPSSNRIPFPSARRRTVEKLTPSAAATREACEVTSRAAKISSSFAEVIGTPRPMFFEYQRVNKTQPNIFIGIRSLPCGHWTGPWRRHVYQPHHRPDFYPNDTHFAHAGREVQLRWTPKMRQVAKVKPCP